jgi:hypothetical protein
MNLKSKVEVPQRMEEFDRASRYRLLESALKPLAGTDPPAATEPSEFPADLLIGRLKDLDRAIYDLRRDLQKQKSAGLKRASGSWFRMIVVVLLTWGVTSGLPKLFAQPRHSISNLSHDAYPNP